MIRLLDRLLAIAERWLALLWEAVDPSPEEDRLAEFLEAVSE